MGHLAIIPARSGSKGLKDKNIKELKGIPLLAYSIRAALDSEIFSEVMVSTDSEEYADIAKKYGASVPFFRSTETSGDNAGSWDVVKEVLGKYLELERKFDTICLLQPTSPLRTSEDIKNGYTEYQEKEADAITAVCEVEHSPVWTMILPENHSLKEYRKKSIGDVPRQQLGTYYRVNGAIYIRRIVYEENEIRLISDEEYAYIMPKERSIDIDDKLDFAMAETVINSFEL